MSSIRPENAAKGTYNNRHGSDWLVGMVGDRVSGICRCDRIAELQAQIGRPCDRDRLEFVEMRVSWKRQCGRNHPGDI